MIELVKMLIQFIKDLNTFCDIYVEEVVSMGDY